MEGSSISSKARILVVDDEPGMLHMFTALLTVAGYDVHTELSGAEALEYLLAQAEELDSGIPPVDLLILDVLMPGMGGHEVCRQVKTHPKLKYIPVLMVTALSSLKDRINGVDIGADDYLPKPFRTEDLLVRLRALLRIGQIQRELLLRNAQLASLRNFNESILQNMGNGLLTVDPQDRITTLNHAAAELLGCSVSDCVGRPLSAYGEGLGALERLINQTLKYAQPTHQEINISRASGEIMPLRANTTLLQDDAQSVSSIICVLEDLREIKAMEEEQRRLDRLAVLGQMAATVAHEIRNPLLTLSLGIQYLEKSLGDDDKNQDAVHRLRRQVDRLTQIMNEFLAFARPPTLNLASCDVGEILDRVADMAEPGFIQRGITLNRGYLGKDLGILLDAEHMERALTNLVLNAMDAMEAGGELDIRASTVPTEEWLASNAGSTIPTPDTSEMIILELQDTGSGIAPEVMDRIFEPFFTTKSKGTGLGLAIVQRTIREHAGHISVASQVGKGTIFKIALPRRM